MPNGDYIATVDFGESVVRDDILGAAVRCEVEDVLVCPAQTGKCTVYRQPITVEDGYFTVTGYSHDTGACHSVSLVRLEACDAGCANAFDVIEGGADETYEYVGCYVDAADRTMNNNNEANGNEVGAFGDLGALATPHLCADMCAGYDYFGVQYRS